MTYSYSLSLLHETWHLKVLYSFCHVKSETLQIKVECIVECHFMYFNTYNIRIIKGYYSQIEAQWIVRILREERSYWCWVHCTSVVTLSGGYFPSLSVDKRAVTRISQCRCQHHGHMVAVYESKIKGNSQLATRVPESVELILRDR